MELKFKEVDEKEYSLKDEGDSGIRIKPYLTIEEIQSILNMLIEEKDVLAREVIYYTKLTEYCTNIDMSLFEEEDGNLKGEDVYNFVVSYKDVDFDMEYTLYDALYCEIRNAKTPLDMLDKIEGVNNTLVTFINELNPKLDELMGNLDMNKLESSIMEMKNLENISVK